VQVVDREADRPLREGPQAVGARDKFEAAGSKIRGCGWARRAEFLARELAPQVLARRRAMTTRLSPLSLTTSLLLLACGTPDVPPPGELVGSSKERITSAAPAADLEAAVKGNTDFALDLYRVLTAGKQDNLFISPQSITLALSMTYAGAAGTTATAFESTLHQGLSAARYHRAMNDLDRQLTSRGQGVKAADGQPFRLNIANQLFAEKRFTFELPFLDTLAQEYGANVRLMDFLTQPEPSRLQINDWVAKKTEDRIKDLLPERTITRDTRAVLVNAMYFNAAWKTQFDPERSRDVTFHAIDGTSPLTPMMTHSELPARAATVNGVEVVSLPYDGDDLSMLILMPPPGTFTSFEQGLTAQDIDGYVAALMSETLELTMPKFELRTSASLNEPLSTLGLGIAFSDDADFSAMSKDAKLAITDVVHQSFVKVNESGTEAAAATGVVVGLTSIPLTRPVTIDRPFIFAIRDEPTGAIVFLGRYVKP
jgi:serpin B